MRNFIEIELFRRGEYNIEEYDDDIIDGRKEVDDNWNNTNYSAFSRGRVYNFSKEYERLGEYPIVFSKMRENAYVTLDFLRTGEVQNLSIEDFLDCAFLASTCMVGYYF